MKPVGVVARQSNGVKAMLSATPLAATVLWAGPTVAVVIDSFEDGTYQGHLELSPEAAAVFGQSLIEAANAAGQKKEEDQA